MCEHHLLPFAGRAHIAYMPDKKVLGLSKFARITDMFAKRLQLQEKLTHEIADALFSVLRYRITAAAPLSSVFFQFLMHSVNTTIPSFLTFSFRTFLCACLQTEGIGSCA